MAMLFCDDLLLSVSVLWKLHTLPILSTYIRCPCSVHWHVMAPYKLYYYYYYYLSLCSSIIMDTTIYPVICFYGLWKAIW